jgi:hypothetical protein
VGEADRLVNRGRSSAVALAFLVRESPANRPRLPQLLAHVQVAINDLRDREEDVDKARERFRDALAQAHKAGASFADLGRLVGLTRQRVARIVSD